MIAGWISPKLRWLEGFRGRRVRRCQTTNWTFEPQSAKHPFCIGLPWQQRWKRKTKKGTLHAQVGQSSRYWLHLWWTLLHFSVYCTAISLKMTSYSQLSPGWRAYTSCSESGKNGNYIYRSSLCCVRLRYPPKQNPHKICQTWAQA